LYYFESELHQVKLTQEELNGTMCGLVKKIYKKVQGSTCLEVVFDHFRLNNIRDKNVIIITDGDCDPNHGTVNPFHSAPKTMHGLRYVVVNVKETKMNFPYLGLDPDVSYVTGNNPNTLNGLIKALIISMCQNIPITPTLVLSQSLDMDELVHNFNLKSFVKKFDLEEKTTIFKIFQKNRPPLKKIKPESESDSDSDSEDTNKVFNSDYNSDSDHSTYSDINRGYSIHPVKWSASRY